MHAYNVLFCRGLKISSLDFFCSFSHDIARSKVIASSSQYRMRQSQLATRVSPRAKEILFSIANELAFILLL